MRDILDLLDVITEATLSPGQITKYPERFDAFIDHIRSNRPFFTEKDGTEVVLVRSEADRFLKLHANDQFKGNVKGMDINGNEWPLSQFRKTSEFGGASAKPGADSDDDLSKEGVLVKPNQIGLTDRDIPAIKLMGEINANQTLRGTEYGKVVIALARSIAAGDPAIVPQEYVKNAAIKKAIVDYAGEYLGVLALVHGQSKFPKQEEFLEWLGGSISSLVLRFPAESNTPLADSFATITDPKTQKTLNISSKGTGGGAAPSMGSLQVPDQLRKKKAFATAIDIIDLCQNKNLPSPTSISQVFQMMNLLNERIPDKVPKQFKKFLPWPLSIINEVNDSRKKGTPLPKYNSLIADLMSDGSDGGKLTYVVKAAVMELINGGAVPEFQAAVLEILDYNFIQQYTTITNKTGQLQFVTQWPAKLDGEVSMETKSGGTDPTKGGFSFKLQPKGQAKAVLPSQEINAQKTKKIEKKIEKMATGTNRLDIRPKRAAPASASTTEKGRTIQKR